MTWSKRCTHRSWFWTAMVLVFVAGSSQAVLAAKKRKPYKPKLEVAGEKVRHPIWGVELSIPGYTAWKDNPQLKNPKLVLAAYSSTSCRLNLTMWAERIPNGTTAEECRRSYNGNPEALRKDQKVKIHEIESAPVVYSLFDIMLTEGGQLVNNQLYGYWVREDHCFELHASSMACKNFPAVAKPILESVKILPDTGATVETVGFAMAEGGDPRDWQLHGAVAGYLLHQTEPAETERARRFYLSALTLGGSSIDARNRWLYEAGVGLSWLMENQGAPAIPGLVRALELSKGTPELNGTVGEATHNLACAHALAGETDAACGIYRDYIQSLDPADRPGRVREIIEDPQLENMRKAECYRKLLEDIGLKEP